MEEAFLKDKFNPAIYIDCLAWALRQKKRIKAFAPESTTRRICDKILFRLDAEISTQVRSLMGDHTSWDKFSTALQEVCKNPNIAKRYRTNTNFKNRNVSTSKFFTKENISSSNQAQPSIPIKKNSRPCPKCGITDNSHEWKTCKGKNKPVNNIEF
ncbi:hypothetical protein CROQUDRAFT_480862 [Cronartium quercuum f. sp. fusiforme G11]|uniref:Uncharacterized protein n=1 Tax=Cronartium quercuum f. sp. fusiforme G11 TaxID=708437 RepID=A0A9P6TD27_9BASI|nr:hypothetical protein CROQUDRAFT_480862 [Cronartium quercuum f. sp. fusiforme G11]